VPSTKTGKESAVSAAVETWRKAVIAADRSALDKIIAAELSYGHSSGRSETKAEFIEAIASGKSGFSAVEIVDQTVEVVGNIALARFMFNATRKKEGDKVKFYTLTVWLEQQGQWRLLARQSAKL
jgi:ketosteroid isomerase-like protein